METKNVIIGVGLGVLIIGTIILIVKHNEEPKGEGDVSANSKTGNKFVFTRNK